MNSAPTQMTAITVEPATPGSVRLDSRAVPQRRGDQLLVQAIALGICGTDSEIIRGAHGAAPPGQQRLIIGHESLGRVLHAPQGSGFAPEDWVVGIVRRPDPIPCAACAGGEWDMCRNGLYSERGIRGRDGYGAQFYVLEPDFAVQVDRSLGWCAVLVEPASIVCKAWDHIERIGARSHTWSPRRVLVTGAGPVGLLATLMARMRGLDVHVLDRAQDGPKPALVQALGATYYADRALLPEDLQPDVVLECTGAPQVVLDVLTNNARGAIVCLVGLSSAGAASAFDAAGFNRMMVLENDVVFGTVNANRAHYEMACAALARADREWLARLITRRVPLHRWEEAFEHRDGDVKVVIEFDGALS